jgi:hypothetical protein
MAIASGWKTISGPMGAAMAQVDSSAVFRTGATEACAAYWNASSSAVTHYGKFRYVTGVASCVAGSWLALNPDTTVVALLADAHRGGVAVAVSALEASSYGWVQFQGKGIGLIEESTGDNAALFATTTAGEAGPTGSGLTEIFGARAAAASGTSSAATNTDVELNYPVCTSVEPA